MAGTTINGLTFELSSAGQVLVTGPGIPSSGIFIGTYNNLTIRSFTSATTSPNVTEPATSALLAITQSDLEAIQAAVAPTPPAPEPPPAEDTVAQTPTANPPEEEGTPLTEEEQANIANAAPPGEASYTPPATNTTTAELPPAVVTKSATQSVGTDTPAGVATTAASVATGNPLNDFASYTYNLTLFILTSDDFNNLAKSSSGWNPQQALISSAGRYNDNTANSVTVRNPEFLDNFYFTHLDISTVIGLNESSRSSNSIEVKFGIIEPYGMTLLDRLINASTALGGSNYTAQPYLLQIDFFGIKEDGSMTQLTNQRKRIPINIIDFKIKVGKSGATYDVSCIPYNHVALTTYNNSSPGSFEVTASTVGEFFDPNSDNSASAALTNYNRLETDLVNAQTALNSATTLDPQYRSKATQVNDAALKLQAAQQALANANYNVKSFADAWNKWHLNVKDAKIATENNEIAFVFDDEIKNSKIVDADGSTTSPGQTPMTNAAGKTAEAKVQTGAAKSNNNYQTSKKAFHVAQGDSIVKLIEDVVRQSEYFRSQLINDAETKKLDLPTNKDINWIKIIPQVELKSFDTNRNEYAKKTTYYVKKHTVKNTKHPQVALSGPPAPVKEYNYIYTGLNTDVLDFDIEFNAAYYVSVTLDKNLVQSTSGAPVAQIDADAQSTAGITPPVPNSVTPRVTKVIGNDAQSSATMDASRDAKAQLASSFIKSLYTNAQGDMISLKLKINGDPTLIKQDDVYANPSQSDYASSPGINPATGSVNMDSGQVFCRVNFLTPTDIDTDTGLLIKNAKYTNSTFNGYYQILTVDNHFANGKFEQTLELVRIFDVANPATNVERSQ
jgi:hypothetical protein